MGSPRRPVPPPPPPGPPPPALPSPPAAAQGGRLRALHWEPVPAARVRGRRSVWVRRAAPPALDLPRLRLLFREPRGAAPGQRPPPAAALLEPKRSLALGVFLKQVKRPVRQIVRDIQEGVGAPYGAEKLLELSRMLPSATEVARLRSFPGSPHQLADPELFMLLLTEVPSYTQRLELLVLKEDFFPQLTTLRGSIQTLTDAAVELLECEELHTILHLILSAGNYLNSGSYAGSAAGFRLASLLKLPDTKANEPGVDLLHFVAMGAGAAACSTLHPLPSALLPLAPACPSSAGSGPSCHRCHSPPQRPVCLQGHFCPSQSVRVLVQVTPAETWQHIWLGTHAPGWPQPHQANGELPLPFPRGLALQRGQLCRGSGDAPGPVGAARCPSHPQEVARVEKSLLDFPGKLRHVGPASRIEVAEVEGELRRLAGRLEGAQSLGAEGLGPQLQPFLRVAEEELRGAWDALERMHRAAATTLDFFCEDTAPGGLQDLCAILHGFTGRLLTAAQENQVREQAQHRRQQLEQERLKRRSIATCSVRDVAPQDVGLRGPFPLTPQPVRHGLHSPRPSSEPCLAAPRGDDPLASPGPPGCGSPRLPPALQSPTWPPGASLAPLRRHTAPALPALPEVGGCNQPSPGAPASRQGGLFESGPKLCLPEPPPPVAASAPASPAPFFSLASLFQRSRAQSRSVCPQPPPAAPPEGSALLGFLRCLAGGKGHGAPPS
ncbi:FH2 domain-containing protein 1-like isoform X1 [Haliaeetus albicilla]|uniref:FH2 domain-containing protein 1-like isoform X1 n=1 Tax=Haliaeetus albicilla TaxID=8969 RepID=UPI0037E9397B